MKTPKVGDIAVIHARVLCVGSHGLNVKMPDGRANNFRIDEITEFTSPPWEPKVGDTVIYNDYKYKLVLITGDWAIIEYNTLSKPVVVLKRFIEEVQSSVD